MDIRSVAGLFGQASLAVVRKHLDNVMKRYPGLSWETIFNDGWIPIPEEALNFVLNNMIRDSRSNITTMKLCLDENVATIDADVKAKWAHLQTTSKVGISEFLFNQNIRRAQLVSLSDVDVRGRNVAGMLSSFFVRAILIHLLKSGYINEYIEDYRVDVEWPHIIVDLDQFQEVRNFCDENVLGSSLLRFIELGPARIRSRRIEVKVSTTELGKLLF